MSSILIRANRMGYTDVDSFQLHYLETQNKATPQDKLEYGIESDYVDITYVLGTEYKKLLIPKQIVEAESGSKYYAYKEYNKVIITLCISGCPNLHEVAEVLKESQYSEDLVNVIRQEWSTTGRVNFALDMRYSIPIRRALYHTYDNTGIDARLTSISLTDDIDSKKLRLMVMKLPDKQYYRELSNIFRKERQMESEKYITLGND